MLLHEPLVGRLEGRARRLDGLGVGPGRLQGQVLPAKIPQPRQGADPRFLRFGPAVEAHGVALAVPQRAVDDAVAAVRHGRVGLDQVGGGRAAARGGQRALLVGTGREFHEPPREGGGRLGPVALAGELRAVGAGHDLELAEHGLPVLRDPAVHPHAVRMLHRTDPWEAGGLLIGDPLVPLPQHDDVARHGRPRRRPERAVGQPRRADQLGPGRQLAPRGARLLIERSRGGDERDEAAGAHVVERLGEEVIVDEHPLAGMAAVVDRELAEGDVGDGDVERVVGQRRRLVALALDGHAGVRVLRYQGGHRVGLHHGDAGEAGHALRHRVGEPARPGGRVEHVAGGEPGHGEVVPHRAGHLDRGVVSGERGLARLGVLPLREAGLEPLALGRVGVRRLVEHLGEAAPPDEREHPGRLLGRRLAALALELLRDHDRFDVPRDPRAGRSRRGVPDGTAGRLRGRRALLRRCGVRRPLGRGGRRRRLEHGGGVRRLEQQVERHLALHHLPAAPGGPAPRRYRLIAMSGISEIMASFSAAAAAFISAAFCCASFAWELCGDRIHACAAAVLRDSASR